MKAQTQQQKAQETKTLQWRKTPTYGSLNLATKIITIITKTTINKTCAMKKNHNIIIKTTTNKSYVCQLMTNSNKQWPQSIEAIETKYMEPLHFQDHKNESSIVIRCIQITKYHNNAKKLSSFLCPFSIDSW